MSPLIIRLAEDRASDQNERDQLKARVAELEKALSYYAKEQHWVRGPDGVHRADFDRGETARLALLDAREDADG
jgi:hypothetical protein